MSGFFWYVYVKKKQGWEPLEFKIFKKVVWKNSIRFFEEFRPSRFIRFGEKKTPRDILLKSRQITTSWRCQIVFNRKIPPTYLPACSEKLKSVVD